MRLQRIPAQPLPGELRRQRVPRAAPGSPEPRREAPAPGAQQSAAPSSPLCPCRGPAPAPTARRRRSPDVPGRPRPLPRGAPHPPSSPALPGVPGSRGGLPGRRPEPPGPRSVRGGGGASLTAQRLRAAPGPRGAPGIFFWETSPGSVGLSLPGRKSAQRREAATIRELRGDVNPPPRLPFPPHPAPAAPPHVDAPRGRCRPFALSSGRRARPACPPARLCAAPPRGPQSRVARGRGSWVPPCPPLRGEARGRGVRDERPQTSGIWTVCTREGPSPDAASSAASRRWGASSPHPRESLSPSLSPLFSKEGVQL